MRYCKNCNIKVENNQKRCPLCLRYLDDGTYEDSGSYPNYSLDKYKKKNLFLRIILMLLVIATSVCTLINVVSWNGKIWSLYVTFPCAYIWFSIKSTIVPRKNYGVKILLQLIAISLLLFGIDMIDGVHSWSVNIVIPFLIVGAIFLNTIIIYTVPMLWKDYIGYLFIIMFIGLIPIVFFVTNIIDILWPSAFSAMYTLLTLIGMFIFSDKKLKNEFVKRFHA